MGDDKGLLQHIINEQIEKLRDIAGKYFCPFQKLKTEFIVGELLKMNKVTVRNSRKLYWRKDSISHHICSRKF